MESPILIFRHIPALFSFPKKKQNSTKTKGAHVFFSLPHFSKYFCLAKINGDTERERKKYTKQTFLVEGMKEGEEEEIT